MGSDIVGLANRGRVVVGALVALATAAAAGWAPPLEAQSNAARALAAPDVRASPVLARGGYAVVIDLDENELHFVQGRTVLWSAPVGTGMALRLETADRKWDFSTPTGVYQVQAKEENPTWFAPDWYFIENKLPVPPENDARRRFPGGLGAAAVYIGKGLAIHGTDKPDLLGQRVSHGCIRLANEYAERLYHNVQVGTEVIIVGTKELEGGELIPGQVPGTGPVDRETERVRRAAKQGREARLRTLGRASVEELEERLSAGLARDAKPGEWAYVAAELVRRVRTDDDEAAARVLLENALGIRDRRIRAEYATFVADVAARRGLVGARALATLPAADRAQVASVIARASLDLFAGEPDDPVLPWPTRRIVASRLDDDSRPGWDALAEAERSAREGRAGRLQSAR
jgi:lipoprotein-anchoring transpeptidase ErfK/SrfK